MPNQPAYQFGRNDVAAFRTWYEKWVYTGWPFQGTGSGAGASQLQPGTTPLIAGLAGWNPSQGATLEAAIEMIQATQSTLVQLQWTVDSSNAVLNSANNQGWTQALRGGVRQNETALRAVNSLSLSLYNSGTAAIDGWQTNYAGSLRRLTVAEKLLAQQAGLSGYALTALEQQALAALKLPASGGSLADLIAKGSQPLAFPRILQSLWRNRILQEQTDLNYLTIPASGTAPAINYYASRSGLSGRVLVLTGIGSSNGGANVILTLARDGQQNYRNLNLAAWAQADDGLWPVWVPAVDSLGFTFALGPGNATATSVPLLLRVATLQLDELLAVWLGLATAASDLTHPDTFWKALVGIT